MLKFFSYLKDSIISMILCFVYKVNILCVFKCQICKSGGESVSTLMQIIFILRILTNDYICHYSMAKLPFCSLGGISSISLILKGLAQIKSYYWKVVGSLWLILMKGAILWFYEKSKRLFWVGERKCNWKSGLIEFGSKQELKIILFQPHAMGRGTYH